MVMWCCCFACMRHDHVEDPELRTTLLQTVLITLMMMTQLNMVRVSVVMCVSIVTIHTNNNLTLGYTHQILTTTELT